MSIPDNVRKLVEDKLAIHRDGAEREAARMLVYQNAANQLYERYRELPDHPNRISKGKFELDTASRMKGIPCLHVRHMCSGWPLDTELCIFLSAEDTEGTEGSEQMYEAMCSTSSPTSGQTWSLSAGWLTADRVDDMIVEYIVLGTHPETYMKNLRYQRTE